MDDFDGDGDGNGDGDRARGFLLQPDPVPPSGGYDIFNGAPYPFPGPSSVNARRVAMAAHDLNSHGDGRTGMAGSEGVGGSGGHPPVRGGSGGRTLGLRAAHSGGGLGATAARTLPSPSGGGRGPHLPAVTAGVRRSRGPASDASAGSRSRGGGRRSASEAFAEDNLDIDYHNDAEDEVHQIFPNVAQDAHLEMDVDTSDESSDEDDGRDYMFDMFLYAMQLEDSNRAKRRKPIRNGLEWVERMLADRNRCYNMFRMSPTEFHRLHDLLVESYGLKSSTKSTSVEALGMFLWILGAPESVRQADTTFERSLDTVRFEKVLKSVIKLAADIIKPVDPEFRTIHPRLRNRRFHHFFNDCIGALDSTHIPCVVPSDKMDQHMCRKNMTTQNVLAVCDFDMRFTFAISGWPGRAHDMDVFTDAMTKFSHVFPHPPRAKFYLVDSGYPNRVGYFAPYKGTKCHLPEFRDGPEPQGKKEIFNFAHSSLRNVIVMAYGVLKMKWRILLQIPSCAPCKQAKIIVACMALHNFIRTSELVDRDFDLCDRDENYVPPEASVSQPCTRPVRDEFALMNAFRDSVALGLFNRYNWNGVLQM